MLTNLTIAAGPSAYAHIQKNGLSADDIAAIFGASGAAKWLAITGLDSAVFGGFMKQRQKPQAVDLFGTSVGAFKLAAAARQDPAQSLEQMADLYIHQSYDGDAGFDKIDSETDKILNAITGAGDEQTLHGVEEILTNPAYHLHIGAVRCHGLLNHRDRKWQALALVQAGMGSLVSAKHLRGLAERVVFSDPRSQLNFEARDGFPVRHTKLDNSNFAAALKASGSIPVYMPPVVIPADASHIYHDGGMLDYHPIPANFWPQHDGLILYPHFYDHFKNRWFDKFYPWRRASAEQLDKVVMIAPNRDYVARLPDGKIPSRQDFVKYVKNEPLRFAKWQNVVARSYALGEEFLAVCASGDIAAHVRPL